MSQELNISITYCVTWNYTARAAWTAQELLLKFADFTAALSLIPGDGGAFEVEVNNEIVYSKHKEGRYPEVDELSDLIADKIT